MNINHKWVIYSLVLFGLLTAAFKPTSAPLQQADNANPPDHMVKLIFIHHSTGQNWLTDDYGDLGKELGKNNYFVSDTNYGWGPYDIGDRTDIPDWVEWFAGENTPEIMNAVLKESGKHSPYTRALSDPGDKNEIIMFKSCFPNSNLSGKPSDPPGNHAEISVGGAKYVYNAILRYFATRPDKLFIVVTAPPVTNPTYAENARAFNLWLVNDWLEENNYTLNNVAVFDFYNVLTDPNAHHRFINGQVEHVRGTSNILYYPSGDDHPSIVGSQKATKEFVPLLNVFYNRYAGSQVPIDFRKTSPFDGATNQPLTLSLTWEASDGIFPAAAYEYCYDTERNNTCDTKWDNVGLYRNVELRGLSPNTKYFWQVRAINDVGVTESNNGSWHSFTTANTEENAFPSIASDDGWILERNENGSQGGSKNTAGSLRVGDDGRNRQYRSILSFDTSDLPNNAVISKVILKVMPANIVGNNPFATHGDLLADIKKGSFNKTVLETTDFQAKGVPKPNVGCFIPASGEPGWYQLVFSPGNFQYINLSGVTQFRLRFAKDDDNDRKADFVSFFSGDNATSPPILIIKYVTP